MASESKPTVPMKQNWGNAPWTVEFHPEPRAIPESVDFAVIGTGFAGCAAAAWLKHVAPEKSVALFEAERIGAGSSGHTGGTALQGSAAGNLPGLGDVLSGLADTLRELRVDADLALPGAWELKHNIEAAGSPIRWRDSGVLSVAKEVAGGTIDPGKMVGGLARAAHDAGAFVFENARVTNIDFSEPLRLTVGERQVRARRVLITTNAQSLELSGLVARGEPKFTLALATAPLTGEQLELLGLSSRHVFYTEDLPYLWGRLLNDNSVVFGAGLVHLKDWRDLAAIDVSTGETARLFSTLEKRVHGFHDVLRGIEITHRWGGPILFANEWVPVFERHPKSDRAIVLGAWSGHGVAISVHLGRWAAEALLERRELPDWRDASGDEE
jgi:glycine/D-amino acid oxidase-like deaminating enzyme